MLIRLIILAASSIFLASCRSEKAMQVKKTDSSNTHHFMVRYNVHAAPEMFTTSEVIWRAPNRIKFVDQNGITREVGGTFEVIYLAGHDSRM